MYQEFVSGPVERIFEDINILLPNFSGAPNKLISNACGDHSFLMEVDESLVEKLLEEGWKIKKWPSKDEPARHYAKILVDYEFINHPKITLIYPGEELLIGKDGIGILDDKKLTDISVTVRCIKWRAGSMYGVRPFLTTMTATEKS